MIRPSLKCSNDKHAILLRRFRIDKTVESAFLKKVVHLQHFDNKETPDESKCRENDDQTSVIPQKRSFDCLAFISCRDDADSFDSTPKKCSLSPSQWLTITGSRLADFFTCSIDNVILARLTWWPCFPVKIQERITSQDVFRSVQVTSTLPCSPCHTFYYLPLVQNRVLTKSQQLAAAPSVKSRVVTQSVIVLTATTTKRASASTSTNVDKERVCSIFVLRPLLTCAVLRVGKIWQIELLSSLISISSVFSGLTTT